MSSFFTAIPIGFEQERYTVFEAFNATGDEIPIPVIKGNSLQSELPFNVIAQFIDGTATRRTMDNVGDFATVRPRTTIPFFANQSRIPFQFELTSDRIPEQPEEFTIELTTFGAPRVVVGAEGIVFGRATIVIIDDDG